MIEEKDDEARKKNEVQAGQENEAHNYIRQAAEVGVKLYMFSGTANLVAAGLILGDVNVPLARVPLACAFVIFNLLSATVFGFMPRLNKNLVGELTEKGQTKIKYPENTYSLVSWLFCGVFVVAAVCWTIGACCSGKSC